MWGGRQRAAHGWLESEGDPQACQVETREHETVRARTTPQNPTEPHRTTEFHVRTLRLWVWLGLVPWPLGWLCQDIDPLSSTPAGRGRKCGVAPESSD